MKTPALVHSLLERSAELRPEHPFLLQDGVATSYGEVETRAQQLAGILIGEGLSRGECVALLAGNSPFYVAAYFAILKAGGIVVPLNTTANAPTLANILVACKVKIMLADFRNEKTAAQAATSSSMVELLAVAGSSQILDIAGAVRRLDLTPACQAASARPFRCTVRAQETANIIFTSGSTGKPRGVTLSHLNIISNATSIVSYLSLGPEDCVLQVLPFYYVYGQSLLITHALAGGTVVIENNFMYPKGALDTLEQTACTGFSGVPSHFAILLNRSDFAERELPALRYVTAAGGAMSTALTRRLMATLPGRQIFIMYGATEASARLSYLAPEDLPRKIGSIGKAIPGVELRVLGKNGQETAVGEQGEIVARGPNIMSGYWEDEEATARVLSEHGYHTGDLAYRDEEGFLFIVGRMRDFIKVGANRVSAREIEDVIAETPDVHEVAVIGKPDDMLGEAVCAFVVQREGCAMDIDQLKKILRRKLPLYKVPTRITFCSDLPRSASGKILKQNLVDPDDTGNGRSSSQARSK